MKKNLILILGILLILFLFACFVQAGSCVDSDGKNLYKKGTVKMFSRTVCVDKCNRQGKLSECRCNKYGTSYFTITYTCPSGSKCKDGACFRTCSPKTCAQLGKQCGKQNNGCGESVDCGPQTRSCITEFGVCSVSGEEVCDNGNYDDCSAVDPRTDEVCDDGKDNDCDGLVDMDDNDCIDKDLDNDGYESIEYGGTDCYDEDASIYPGAVEVCDGINNDCDESTDEGCACVNGVKKAKTCGIGECKKTVDMICVLGKWDGQCVAPEPSEDEVCDDNLDNDCDGLVDQLDNDCEVGGTGGVIEDGNELILSLHKGWNVLPVTLDTGVVEIDKMFGSVLDNIVIIREYGADDVFVFDPKIPARFNSLKTIGGGKAYQIKMKNGAELTISGTSFTKTSVSLHKGWNMMPYLGGSILGIDDVIGSVKDNIVIIREYGADDVFVYDPKIPARFNSLKEFKPNTGYQVKMLGEAKLSFGEPIISSEGEGEGEAEGEGETEKKCSDCNGASCSKAICESLGDCTFKPKYVSDPEGLKGGECLGPEMLCTDTDGGIVPGVKGFIKIPYQNRAYEDARDTSYNNPWVREYYCLEDQPWSYSLKSIFCYKDMKMENVYQGVTLIMIVQPKLKGRLIVLKVILKHVSKYYILFVNFLVIL